MPVVCSLAHSPSLPPAQSALAIERAKFVDTSRQELEDPRARAAARALATMQMHSRGARAPLRPGVARGEAKLGIYSHAKNRAATT